MICPCTGNTLAKLAAWRDGHGGDHGGQGSPAQRRTAGAGGGHERRPGRGCPQPGGFAGAEERVLCPLWTRRFARASLLRWWQTSPGCRTRWTRPSGENSSSPCCWGLKECERSCFCLPALRRKNSKSPRRTRGLSSVAEGDKRELFLRFPAVLPLTSGAQWI